MEREGDIPALVDLGPHVVRESLVIEEVFATLHERASEHATWSKVNLIYKVKKHHDYGCH